MILLDNKNILFRFFIYISILLIVLFISVELLYTEPIKIKSSVINSNISDSDEITTVNVNYPRFRNDKIDKIITDYIYEYIKEFKLNKSEKKLFIDYEIYYKDSYMNIFFNIDSSISNIKHKNIIIDLNNNSLLYISNIFDKEELQKEINEIAYYKYSTDIYDKIKTSNINNHTFYISDEKIDIYFYDIEFKDIKYVPEITIYLNKNVSNNISDYKYPKYIAFTFDDGPSKYTEEILKTLEYNNSTATFFMLGNRMKNNEDIVLKVYNSNNEVESHTYSHKNLTKLKDKELKNEVNSTNIIFNSITNDNIKYFRPPYGSFNDKVKALGYPLILWSIDPKDWLYRDSTKVYNHVIKNACDGCIVLMHDIHLETKEAVKKLIPTLNNMGYNVVSIEKLMEIKNYTPKSGETIRKIK